MRKAYYISLLFFLLFSVVIAQSDGDSVDENIKKCLTIGSAKELVKNFGDIIDLDIEVKKGTFSSSQAEFMLKDFFQLYPARSFQYIHQGGSMSSGQRYAIGKYVSDNASYRVLIRIKRINGKEKIYNLSFTKE